MKQTFDARLVNDSLPPNHHIVVTTAQIKGGVTNHNHRHIVLDTIYFVLDGNSVSKLIRVHVPHIFFVLVAISAAAVADVVVVVAVALVAAHVGVIAVALVAAHIGVCIFRESQVGEFQYCQDYMFVLSNRTC